MNIIIKTPRFIGDTIMMLSAFELLKLEYPEANFTIVTQKINVDIFRNKNIYKIIIDNSKLNKNRVKNIFTLIKDIKKEQYDLGFVFHNTLLDALIFRLSNIKKIIGYNKENSKLFLDFYLKIDRNRHYINHYAYLVNSFLNNKYKKLPEIKLNFVKSKLIEYSNFKNIAFVLGGNNKGNRKYPISLSKILFEKFKNTNYNIILLGDNQDNDNNKIYEDHLKKNNLNVNNLSGKTNVYEFIDVIGSVDLLITIDSSALHIAAATNTRFITLVGKGTSIFEIVKPKVDFGIYLSSDNLDIDDKDLISNIKPSDIFNVIKKLLNE